MTRTARYVLLASLLLGLSVGACTSSADEDSSASSPTGIDAATDTGGERTEPRGLAALPSVAGPLTGGAGAPVVAGTTFDLGAVGYEQSEFLLAGEATAYQSATPLTPDGRWSVTPGGKAPYTTRVVVYRPTDADRFNGNVVVEWLNVSGGVDAGPDWTLTHTELIREGAVWVGVSAQAVGLDATRAADPIRYAAVTPHPGDSFSYDMFSQAGQAVWNRAEAVLGGLTPRHVFAMGESQSAGRLATYVNAIHPLAQVYEGYLIHSRSSRGTPLAQDPVPPVPVEGGTRIRDDLDVPVLVFQTETDVAGADLAARQPDSDRFRLWEVPGTAHYDQYGIAIGPADTGDGRAAAINLETMRDPTARPSESFSCDLPINAGPMHWVMDAAIAALQRWVAEGTPPPNAPLLETTGSSPVTYALDANGNVLGGVRTPHVDAPVARLGGVGNSGTEGIGVFCRLFGNTEPFSSEALASLYPTHDEFVAQWTAATERALRDGFLVEADAAELVAAAEGSTIGD